MKYSNLQHKETRILETCIRLDTSFCPEIRHEIDTRNRKVVFFHFCITYMSVVDEFRDTKNPETRFLRHL